MAAPSPWRLPLTCTITSRQSSGIFPPYCAKRRRINTLLTSFDYSFLSSSSSSFSSSQFCGCDIKNSSNNAGYRIIRIKLVDEITTEIDSEKKEISKFSIRSDDCGNRLNSNPLLGKRAWWRKILLSKKVRGIILLNVITIIYASNIPVVKEVESLIDPEAFTVVRFLVAAIPFLPFTLKAKDDGRTRTAGMELGFWVSLGYLLQALGLLTSDAGRASFIAMFTVIVVPLIDGLLGSKIPARTWFGALMSLIGVAMLESSGSPPCVGDLLNFLSAVSFGIHMLRTERISRRTKKENFLPLLGYQISTVALLSTVWYFTERWFGGGLQGLNLFSVRWETILKWISVFPWMPAFYTGIFSTGLCLWVEMSSMCDVSATETAIIYGLEPVWGAAFAWFLLGERWGVRGWIGAALVLGGSLTVQIMGANSDTLSRDHKNVNKESKDVLISDPNTFSTSPVVKTEKEPSSLIKN